MPPLAYLRLGVLEVSFILPLGLPRRKLPLALLALIESKNVREDAAGNGLNLVLRDVGVVYELFPTTQMNTSAMMFGYLLRLVSYRIPPSCCIRINAPHYWKVDAQTGASTYASPLSFEAGTPCSIRTF